jgi:hypothetical protein
MKILACLILACAICHSAAQSAPSPANCAFHARIVDAAGFAIGDAFVIVHSSGTPGYTLKLSPTEESEYDAQLKPAIYYLFISSTGFVPLAKVVDLRRCKPLNLEVKMVIDHDHPNA